MTSNFVELTCSLLRSYLQLIC